MSPSNGLYTPNKPANAGIRDKIFNAPNKSFLKSQAKAAHFQTFLDRQGEEDIILDQRINNKDRVWKIFLKFLIEESRFKGDKKPVLSKNLPVDSQPVFLDISYSMDEGGTFEITHDWEVPKWLYQLELLSRELMLIKSRSTLTTTHLRCLFILAVSN